MKFYFLTNPAAGKKNVSDELKSQIDAVCSEKGVDYEIYNTSAVGDATRYVKEICEKTSDEICFFACGGDGTLNEVACGAAGYPHAAVGLIPKGTGNDFARNFKNKELFFDISAQLDGKIIELDILRCNDRYAVNMINIGFDCEVVKKMVQIKRSPLVPSKLAYIFGLVITLVRKPGVKTGSSADGADFVDRSLLLTTIANGCFCGGGFHSNPYASLTNGKLDVLYINNVSRIKFVSLVSSYKKGTHIVPKNANILNTQTCTSLTLRFPSTQSVSIDGELHDIDGELNIKTVRNGLRFMLPCGCELKKESEAEREVETV